MQNQPHSVYFLFINSSSGGGVGSKLIEQQKTQKISFQISLDQNPNKQQTIAKSKIDISNNKPIDINNKKTIDVYFYNMKTSRQKGFMTLKEVLKKNNSTRLIICGGDGTVVWVISQLHKHSIDTQQVPLGIIPLGTGNDFSQYLGWGKLKTTLTQNSFAHLKKLIRKWEKANIQEFDIWDVRAEVYQQGKLEKVEQFNNKLIQSKIFQASFCNYFSFGLDGKIGYSFDMHRTKSRFGNLAMYGIMGLLKNMTKTKSINELIHGMEVRPQFSDAICKQQSIKQLIQSTSAQKSTKLISSTQKVPSKMQQTASRIVFKTKNKQKHPTQIKLNSDYYTLVALNINSFMGGVFDIWKNAKNAMNNQDSKSFHPMSSSDGKLEFISFSSGMGMAAERTFGGFAEKIAQGQGPYYFQFKEYDKQLKHRTYLQVDGEFIRFTHPKSVLIRKSILGKNGKVKILRNVQSS